MNFIRSFHSAVNHNRSNDTGHNSNSDSAKVYKEARKGNGAKIGDAVGMLNQMFHNDDDGKKKDDDPKGTADNNEEDDDALHVIFDEYDYDEEEKTMNKEIKKDSTKMPTSSPTEQPKGSPINHSHYNSLNSDSGFLSSICSMSIAQEMGGALRRPSHSHSDSLSSKTDQAAKEYEESAKENKKSQKPYGMRPPRQSSIDRKLEDNNNLFCKAVKEYKKLKNQLHRTELGTEIVNTYIAKGSEMEVKIEEQTRSDILNIAKTIGEYPQELFDKAYLELFKEKLRKHESKPSQSSIGHMQASKSHLQLNAINDEEDGDDLDDIYKLKNKKRHQGSKHFVFDDEFEDENDWEIHHSLPPTTEPGLILKTSTSMSGSRFYKQFKRQNSSSRTLY